MSRRLRAFVVAVVTFGAVTTLGIALGPSPVTGDETEYFAMTYAIATNGTPTLTPSATKAIHDAFPGYDITSVKAADGSEDALHFWFLSALASPFFLLCKFVGLDWRHCFVFVNAVAFAAAIGVASFYFRWRSAALLVIGFATSPLLPYLNKAHGEAFSVSLFTVAVVFLARGEVLAATLALSVISAQVSAFAPLAAIILLYWASRQWTIRRPPSRTVLAIVVICVGLLTLQPLWSLLRHRVLNVIVGEGFVKAELVSLKRMVGMLVDPDIGLFFNWPVGVALALMTTIGLWRNPASIRNNPVYWAFVVGAAPYVGVVSAAQVNYTSSILRYAFWFLPFFMISLILVYESERINEFRKFVAVIAWVWVAGCCANLYYTATVTGFQPNHLRRAPAELWYRYLPAAYDPEEQVYADFTLNVQRVGSYELFASGRYPINALRDPHIWALSNKACTKLLVFAYAFTSSHVQSRLPFGCKEPLDPAQLLGYVRRAGNTGMRDRYVNVSEDELARMRIPAFPPIPASPANQGPRVESIANPGRNSAEATYVIRVSDPNGWQDIDSVFFLVAASDDPVSPGAICYIAYNQPRNLVATKTSAQELILGYPGRSGVLRGAHCTVDSAKVTVAAAGESLTLTLPVALDPVLITPDALVQTGATDLAQASSGWQRAH